MWRFRINLTPKVQNNYYETTVEFCFKWQQFSWLPNNKVVQQSQNLRSIKACTINEPISSKSAKKHTMHKKSQFNPNELTQSNIMQSLKSKRSSFSFVFHVKNSSSPKLVFNYDLQCLLDYTYRKNPSVFESTTNKLTTVPLFRIRFTTLFDISCSIFTPFTSIMRSPIFNPKKYLFNTIHWGDVLNYAVKAL